MMNLKKTQPLLVQLEQNNGKQKNISKGGIKQQKRGKQIGQLRPSCRKPLLSNICNKNLFGVKSDD